MHKQFYWMISSPDAATVTEENLLGCTFPKNCCPVKKWSGIPQVQQQSLKKESCSRDQASTFSLIHCELLYI